MSIHIYISEAFIWLVKISLSLTKIISRLLEEKDKPSNYFGKWKDFSKDDENKLNKAKSELHKLWTDRKLT